MRMGPGANSSPVTIHGPSAPECSKFLPGVTLNFPCRSQSRIVPSLQMVRSEEHTSELQSPDHLVCRLLLEKKKQRCRTPNMCSCANQNPSHMRNSTHVGDVLACPTSHSTAIEIVI